MAFNEFFRNELGRRRSAQPAGASRIPLSPTQVVQGGRGAGALPMAGSEGFLKELAGKVAGNKVRLAGASGLLALLAGASELADQNDPLSRNVAEAVGVTGGGVSGAALGGLIGAAMGGGVLSPITGLAGAAIGGLIGSNAGKGVSAGLYDLVANESPEDRAMRKAAAQERLNIQLAVERQQALAPLQADLLKIKQADDFERLTRQLEAQERYNYSNTLNTAMLNNAQTDAAQRALMSQYLFS